MENNEILMDGLIYHGPGNCPVCGMPIIVVDTETSIMQLDENGVPITEETSEKCGGICSNCGHKLPMVRWEGGYIPYSPTSYLIKCCERSDQTKQRITELNSRSKGKNPFALELEK